MRRSKILLVLVLKEANERESRGLKARAAARTEEQIGGHGGGARRRLVVHLVGAGSEASGGQAEACVQVFVLLELCFGTSVEQRLPLPSGAELLQRLPHVRAQREGGYAPDY